MKAIPLTVYLPDTRGVTVSRFGFGNRKLGMGVFTYSRIAGARHGTCPGATAECEDICYAKRIEGPVLDVYKQNMGDDVPAIPQEATLLRLHVSGDFDSVAYIQNWITRLRERPDVLAWAYTRSWREPELLPHLEELRALPNVQLFASMDPSTSELPPQGWRRAWIWRDKPTNGRWGFENRLELHRQVISTGTVVHPDGASEAFRLAPMMMTAVTRHHHGTVPVGTSLDADKNLRTPAYPCPEETGRRRDCVQCGYCFEGQKHDVVFLEHHGPAKAAQP